MSDLEDFGAFEAGFARGTQLERERIIKLLEPLAQHSELCGGDCYPEDCSAFAYQYAINLVTESQD